MHICIFFLSSIMFLMANIDNGCRTCTTTCLVPVFQLYCQEVGSLYVLWTMAKGVFKYWPNENIIWDKIFILLVENENKRVLLHWLIQITRLICFRLFRYSYSWVLLHVYSNFFLKKKNLFSFIFSFGYVTKKYKYSESGGNMNFRCNYIDVYFFYLLFWILICILKTI